jgi:lipoprotein NlpD
VNSVETAVNIIGTTWRGVDPHWMGRRAVFALASSLALGGCTFTPWHSLKATDDTAHTQPETKSSDASKQNVPPLLPPGPSLPVASPAPSTDAQPGYYRVKPGDTLYRIAATHGQRAADIASWNKLPASGQVRSGQLLRVAPPAPPSAAEAAPSPASHGKARFVWPISGTVAAPFAASKSKGVVIVGAAGQPVKAAAAGRVVYAGSGIKAYGQLVIVRHDARLVTAYGRNAKLLVKEGQPVKQGEVIAQSGTNSAGKASLVFEVRENGKPVDPLAQLPE